MTIQEFSKPWSDIQIWVDEEAKQIVIKHLHVVSKFDYIQSIIVDNKNLEVVLAFDNDSPKTIYTGNLDSLKEVSNALTEANNRLKVLIYPYLCPKCYHSKHFRINHSKWPYEQELLCVQDPLKEDYLDQNDGPGGWNGIECPNFNPNKVPEQQVEITYTTSN